MSRQWILAASIAALVGLAGCIEDYAGDPQAVDAPTPGGGVTDDATGTPEPSPSPTQTTPPEPEPPEDPGRLDATLEPSTDNGNAPLRVTLRLDGEVPRGNPLAWTLDLDGDGAYDEQGTELPVNLTHVYEAGRYNVTFAVSDGNDTIEARDTIVAREPPPVPPPDPITINGTITGIWLQPLGYLPSGNDHDFALPVPVENFTVRLAFGDGSFDLDYDLYDPDGQMVERRANYNEPTGELPTHHPGEPPIHVRGDGAEKTGTWTVRVLPALALEGDYTIRIFFN